MSALRDYEKIMLGTSDACLMSHSSQWPSKPVYCIEDCRISSEQTWKVRDETHHSGYAERKDPKNRWCRSKGADVLPILIRLNRWSFFIQGGLISDLFSMSREHVSSSCHGPSNPMIFLGRKMETLLLMMHVFEMSIKKELRFIILQSRWY